MREPLYVVGGTYQQALDYCALQQNNKFVPLLDTGELIALPRGTQVQPVGTCFGRRDWHEWELWFKRRGLEVLEHVEDWR